MKIFRKISSPLKIILRYFSNISREYNVQPTGHLNIILPFNTIIKPLDVVDYPESNKLIINCPKIVHCSVVKELSNISTNDTNYDSSVTCEIQAPIKSNINVTCKGNIDIKDFIGEAVRLFSEHGNITLGSFKNDYVVATTNQGDIITQGSIDAAKVEFKALLNGNIFANKLKCLGLHMKTENGKMETKSSYCEESYFVTKSGDLNLQNVHKHCKLVQLEGKLNMIGFNGQLDLMLTKGTADIQISELTGNSVIHIKEKGQLTLHLSESVLENTSVEIDSDCCVVEDSISHEENELDSFVHIKPTALETRKLYVRAKNAVVMVKSGSWADMIGKQLADNAQKI